jgi:hypothetical protein
MLRQLAQTLNQRFGKIASWRKRSINDLEKSPVGANVQSTIWKNRQLAQMFNQRFDKIAS